MQQLVGDANVALDVGAHIGYFSTIYSEAVGASGRVYAFEPGENNLPYLSWNVSSYPQTQVVKAAASDYNGTATFYVEHLTGQNNTLVENYEAFTSNARDAYYDGSYQETLVKTLTLDSFCKEHNVKPDFIKIDVEGNELKTLSGMEQICEEFRPVILTEISLDHEASFSLIRSRGYRVYDVNLIEQPNSIPERLANYLCVHESGAKQVIGSLSV